MMDDKWEIIADVLPGVGSFEGIETFLEAIRDAEGGGTRKGAKFCETLAWASGWARDANRARDNPGIPVPWVTPVLGAELLDSLPPTITQEQFTDTLQTALTKLDESGLWGLDKRGERKVKLVRPRAMGEEIDHAVQFAWALLNSRDSMDSSKTATNKTPSDGRLPEYDDVQLYVIVAAYSLSRAYFFSKLVHHAPLNREEDQVFDAIELGFAWSRNSDHGDPETVLWTRARHALENLKSAAWEKWNELKKAQKESAENEGSKAGKRGFGESQGRATKADPAAMIWQLADQMIRSIGDSPPSARVSSGSLLLLTEIAWHYLVDTLRKDGAPQAYHCWSEQLIAIELEPDNDTQPPADGQVGPTPNRVRFLNGTEPLGVSYQSSVDAITREFSGVTGERATVIAENGELVRSGDRRGLSPRVRTYLGVTNLLWAQADVRREAARLAKFNDKSANPPVQPPLSSTSKNPLNVLVGSVIRGEASAVTATPVPPAEDTASSNHVPERDKEQTEKQTEDGHTWLSMKAPPYAVAVVTTFDIELELSLWHYHQRPFIVLFPVNVVVSTNSVFRGQQAWLGYVVRPRPEKDAVNAITNPGESLFVMESQVEDDPERPVEAYRNTMREQLRDADMPIVVKMCGSPLVKLPEISQPKTTPKIEQTGTLRKSPPGETPQTKKTPQLPVFRDLDQLRFSAVSNYMNPQGGVTPPKPELRHALVIEDIHAMSATLPEADEHATLSLPDNIRGAVSNGYWRYWVLLGVDLADSALRYRLVGHMLASTWGPGRPKRQIRAGAAISQHNRVTRKALSLLQWRLIEVIHDNPHNFYGHLDHYTQHIKDTESRTRKVTSGLDGEAKEQTDPVSRLTWINHGHPCEMDSENGGQK